MRLIEFYLEKAVTKFSISLSLFQCSSFANVFVFVSTVLINFQSRQQFIAEQTNHVINQVFAFFVSMFAGMQDKAVIPSAV
jgi:hypothetical protein